MTTPPTTEEERAAMAWLEQMVTPGHGEMEPYASERRSAARTIKAMLSRPVMPEEPSAEILGIMLGAYERCPMGVEPIANAYHACRAALSKPAFKVVTRHVKPPVPSRAYDWCAYFDGEEERGRYGWGETEAIAIRDMFNIYEGPERVSAITAALVERNAA